MDKKHTRITNAGTDTETGQEGKTPEDERSASLFALKSLYERGLITEEEYRTRVKELDG